MTSFEDQHGMAETTNAVKRLIKRRQLGEARARRRRAIDAIATLLLLSVITTYALMLIAGMWHDVHPSIPAPSFLLIWVTLLVARAAVSTITAQITPPRRSGSASRKS